MDKEKLDKGRAEQIDQNLRRVFADLAEEDLPDRFKDLLQKLKSGETPPSGGEEGIS